MHCVAMNVCRAECVTELGPNNSEPEAREASVGRTYASTRMHCITMNVCRAECVTELGSNNSEPERTKRARAHLCERIYAMCNDKCV